MASDALQKGQLKKQLYDIFKGKVETDVIDMVFDGCNHQVGDAITAISNMCLVPEEEPEKTEHGSADQDSLLDTKYAVHSPPVESQNSTHTVPRTKQRTMFIMRGLPGSGKTFLANKLKQKNDLILSADDYFRTGNRFEFRGDQLQDAHKWNLERARAAMRQTEVNNIFIDNTNTRCWEMKPYILVARKLGYHIEILLPETPWAWDVNELERRNTHSVPKGTLLKMLERFEKDVTIERILMSDRMQYQTRSRPEQRTSPIPSENTGVRNYGIPRRNSSNRVEEDGSSKNIPSNELEGAEKSKENISHYMEKDESENKGTEMVIDDNFDEDLDMAYTSIGDEDAGAKSMESDEKNPKKVSPESSMSRDDLEFLLECFPDYENDVLESVYIRFNGNMERICNEIMEQPLVQMNAADRLQSINENLKYVEVPNESNETNECSSSPGDNTSNEVHLHIRPDRMSFGSKDGNFIICLHAQFINAMKKRLGEAEDEFLEEDLEFPVDNDFAEQAFRQWKRYCKVKRKRRDMMVSKGKKVATGNDEAELPHPKRACKQESDSRASQVNKKKDSKGKLKGTFKPWSTKPPGQAADVRFPEPDRPVWDVNKERSENRLYTMFPTVPKDVLDNIYEAMGFNVDDAIQAVKASLTYEVKDKKNSYRTKAETSQHSTENQRELAPVTRRVGNDTVIGLSSGYEKSENNEAFSSSDPDWSVVGQTRSKVVDLTDALDEENFQSLAGTSYADYRAEAQAHAAVRKEWLRKAAKAYTNKHGHVARYCAEEARKQGILMKESNERAAALIFENANSSSHRTGPATVDLHGLHRDEAVEVLTETLCQAQKFNLKYIDVITGRGAHSKGNIPRLKGAVINYLNVDQYRFTGLNAGCLRVYLR